jgi:hypothetical protein
MMQNEEMIDQINHTTDFDTSWPKLPTTTLVPSLVLVSFPMPIENLQCPFWSTIQSIEQIMQDINQQVFDTKYTLNLGKLRNITLELKRYLI